MQYEFTPYLFELDCHKLLKQFYIRGRYCEGKTPCGSSTGALVMCMAV